MRLSLAEQKAGGTRQSTLVLASLCVLAGLAAYANGLSGPLVMDDQASVLFNPQIRHLWPLVDALAPPRNSALYGRPLVNLSFAVNYALGGLSVPGYHLVNVGLHILSALLLFGIVRLTLARPGLRDRFAATADTIALACAVIWLVHPIQTESVDYLTQRTELMMGLFYLLTMYAAIRALQSATPNGWHVAAIVSCLLGAGCKESIVTVPLLVVLYDRIFVFDSMKEALRARKTLYLGLALSWIELAALVGSRNSTAGFGAGTSVWTYLLNQAQMVSRYLALTIWPHALVIDYGPPRLYALPDVLPQALLITGLVGVTAFMLVRRPMAGFLGAWFFITLAPTSSFLPIVSEVGAERRMYLPLAGLVVAAVLGVYRWTRTSHIAPYLLAGLVAALAFGTAQRNRDYASKAALLQTSVDRWPHGRAHYNLALAMKAQGRVDETIAHLRSAVAEIPQAQFALGSELYARREFDAAITALQTYVSLPDLNPADVVNARNLLALSFAQQGQLPRAVDALQQALQQDPGNPELHGNLGFVLLQQRNFAEARQHYEASLAARPGNAFVLGHLGVALAALGDRAGARARFREALALDPTETSARAGLSTVTDAQ